jgi:hypothetical protein
VHTDSVNGFATPVKLVGDNKMTEAVGYGPGGRFSQKNGRPIQIDTQNPVRTYINRGLTTKNNKGSLKLNMTGYQLMPVQKGGAPFLLKAKDPDGMIEEIKKLPYEYFKPDGMGLQPEMKIGINGYTINEASLLGDVNDKLLDISNQIADARDKHDTERLSALEGLEYDVNELKSAISSGDYDGGDLTIAANKVGIKKIKDDLIIPADNSDIASIKNVTGGFNLNDKSFWSPDMKEVEQAWKDKYEEAKKNVFSSQQQTENHVVESNGSDVDSWKEGTEYKVGNNIYFYDKKSGKWQKR